MSFRITGNKKVARNIQNFGDRYQRNIGVMVGAFTGRMEAKAVRDRPWTDRTSMARNSIHGTFDETARKFIVCLAIGVEYGVFLETARGGKYRVVRPTVDAMREEFKQIPRDALKVTRL